MKNYLDKHDNVKVEYKIILQFWNMKWVLIRFLKVCKSQSYLAIAYPLFLESTYYTFCKISLMYWPNSSFSFFFLHLNSVGKTKQYMSHPSLKSAVLFLYFNQDWMSAWNWNLDKRDFHFPIWNILYMIQGLLSCLSTW